MTAVSASPVNLLGTLPTTDLFTTPLHNNNSRFADQHSGGQTSFLNTPKPSASNTPKPSASNTPKSSTSSDAPGENYVNEKPALASDPPYFAPIDETASLYSTQDFTHLDSTGVTRTASMSPEMAMQAELDLEKTDSKVKQPEVPSKFITIGEALARRQRAYSAPIESGPNFLHLLNQKLKAEGDRASPKFFYFRNQELNAEEDRADDDESDDDTLTLKHWTEVPSEPAHKLTKQEWVSDIDRVSDIYSAMLADDDRGGVWS